MHISTEDGEKVESVFFLVSAVSTVTDVFTLNTTIAEKTQAVNATETSRATTTRTFPHAAHGFNFVLNSSATKNGSVFFFSEDVVTTARVTTVESYSSKTPENVTPDPNFDSSAWAAMGNTEKNDVAKNSEPHKTTENVTTVEDRNMDTLSASEITTTPKSTETKLHGNPINMANVADEDGDSKILSTVLEDSTTTLRTIETKPSTSTESDIIDPFTEERNFETSSIVESTTTSTIIPRIQTTIIANTQNTSKHNQLISGANIIISALTTILGIILGFILIDFIFW